MANTLNFIAASSEIENEHRTACSTLQQMVCGRGEWPQKGTKDHSEFRQLWCFLCFFVAIPVSSDKEKHRTFLESIGRRSTTPRSNLSVAAISRSPQRAGRHTRKTWPA